MQRDPHDDLLLTKRPTTVVTQATSLLDNAPAPFGDVDDEEFIFAGIAADDGDLDNAATSAAARAGVMSRVPNVAPVTSPLNPPLTPPAQPAPSIWPVVAILGGLVGITWLMSSKRS
jgi:hypothetical protein